MKLFCYALSPYSKKVLLVAHERGVEIESEDTPPYDKEAMANLRRMHTPLATVPLLRLDDGTYLTDSSPIAEWIDLVGTTGPRLIPEDPHVAFHVREHDRLADLLFNPIVYLTWALTKRSERNDEKISGMQQKIHQVIDELEARRNRSSTEFLVGDTFTLADVSVSAALETALYDKSLADLSRWPKVDVWLSRVLSRPSWERVIQKGKTLWGPSL